MSNKSLFITLEGIEGTGKSTLITALADSLEKKGIEVIKTREPGGCKAAELIRNIILDNHDIDFDFKTELLLMYAARNQHIEQVIKPALREGKVVLCDRYFDASHAYQGYGRMLDLEFINILDKFVLVNSIPDLTLLLDADVNLCLSRISKRKNKDRFDSESIEFFSKVRAGYDKIALENSSRVKKIDVSCNLSKVLSRAMMHIDKLLDL